MLTSAAQSSQVKSITEDLLQSPKIVLDPSLVSAPRHACTLDLRAFFRLCSGNPGAVPWLGNLENLHPVTLDEEHRTKAAAAVADIMPGEIKGFLLAFQRLRQALLRAVAPTTV